EQEVQKAPGLLEFPNLDITILEPDAGPWLSWYDAFRQGRNGADSERSGHISFLPRVGDRARPLVTLDILGMGVLRVQHHKSQAAQNGLAKVKVELFCDSMDLKPGPGTVRA